MGLKHHAAPQFFLGFEGVYGGCARRGSQRRVVCGLNTHGCKPVLRNAIGLGLGHDSGGVAMPLSKRSQDAPEPLSKWFGRVPRSVFGWNA